MSKEYRLQLPKLGESIVQATVIQWFKKEGDWVKLDEPLLEVATDKVNSEIPSPVSGILTRISVLKDQDINVGDELAVIELNESLEKKESFRNLQEKTPSLEEGMHNIFSPAVLKLISEHHLSQDELATIRPTGLGKRLTKRDLENYLENRNSVSKKTCLLEETIKSSRDEFTKIKMSPLRKTIADNMIQSVSKIPHATLITEIDVTSNMKWIEENKEIFLKQHQTKLTMTSLIAQAFSKTLKLYPLLNSSLEGDDIIVKNCVNLGIAVSVEQGVLVPIIYKCEDKTILEIAQSIQDLSFRCRSQKLNPSETRGGTVTLTNFGASGILQGIPIIRYPEAAILAIGAIQKKIVVLNDAFVIVSVMNVSLTFDHRIIDGIYGCEFLKKFEENLHKLYLTNSTC